MHDDRLKNEVNIAKKHQHGGVTIFVAVILMLCVTILTLFSSKTAVMEQRVSANDYRAREAFEAAEAGLEKGIAYIQSNAALVVADTNNDGLIDAYANAAITNAVLTTGATFNVLYSNTANNFKLVTVTSTGTSPDGLTTAVVRQMVQLVGTLPNMPDNPFTAKGNVDLGGNLSINSEGATTIWSGGTSGLSGSASTLNGSGVSSDSHGSIQSDIVQNDASLATLSGDQFFQNFFNASKSQIKAGANLSFTNSSDTNYSASLDGQTGKLIWIDQSAGGSARINGNTTIGSATQPVILVINGDAHLNGNLEIYGVVYIIGNWNNSGGGTLSIHGGAMIEGDMSGTGTPNVTSSGNIKRIITNTMGTYAKVPGTWRDF